MPTPRIVRFAALFVILASAAYARRDRHHAASGLTGMWTQSGWRLCTPIPELQAEQIDKPITELWFGDDGKFNVTWVPFEYYRDYWGRYTYDAASHIIELTIEQGNFIPSDFVGRGTATLSGDTLTLRGVQLGTKEAKHRPPVCELHFRRS